MNFDRELDHLKRQFLADSDDHEARVSYINALRRRNNLPYGEWLQLNDGTQIQMQGLYQEHTWVGVIAGIPKPRHNRSHLTFLPETAQTIWPGISVHLFERERWEGEKELLPYVSCCARFNGTSPAKGDHFSTLTFCWFQDFLAPPISEPILNLMKNFNWRGKADGWEY